MKRIQYITLALAVLLLSAGAARAELTPAQMSAQADSIIDRMNGVLTFFEEELDIARKQRGPVKINCLNNGYTELEVVIRSAWERRDSLAAAVQRNDAVLSNREFTILSYLCKRSDQLKGVAVECIEEDAGVVDAVDPGLVEEFGAGDDEPPALSVTYTIVFRNAAGQEKRMLITFPL